VSGPYQVDVSRSGEGIPMSSSATATSRARKANGHKMIRNDAAMRNGALTIFPTPSRPVAEK
jgi:hypothetical protein